MFWVGLIMGVVFGAMLGVLCMCMLMVDRVTDDDATIYLLRMAIAQALDAGWIAAGAVDTMRAALRMSE